MGEGLHYAVEVGGGGGRGRGGLGGEVVMGGKRGRGGKGRQVMKGKGGRQVRHQGDT